MVFADLFSLRQSLTFLLCYVAFLFLVLCYMCLRDLFNMLSESATDFLDQMVWQFDDYELNKKEMAKEALNSEECKNIMRKFLSNEKFELENFEIFDFHNPLQGLVGEHFTLKIKYKQGDDRQEVNFFVKTLSNNVLMQEISKSLQVYEKETFFYQILDKFEEHKIDTSFAPKGFFFKPYIVVLEDLSRGYKGTPKRILLDLEHSKAGLESLAKFHASSIIYTKKNEISLKEEKVLEDPFANKAENGFPVKWKLGFVKGLLEFIDVIPENKINQAEFKEKIVQVCSSDESIEGLVYSVIHADLWTGNILYSYKNGKPEMSKLLDFQFVKYGPVESDVAEFIMTNTSRLLHSENYESLVLHYYQKLNRALADAGLNTTEILPPESEFVESCNNFKLAGKLHAVLDHSYTFTDNEIYEDVLSDEKTFRKFLYEERGKYMIESYNRNEQYRRMLLEDVTELRDLLFA